MRRSIIAVLLAALVSVVGRADPVKPAVGVATEASPATISFASALRLVVTIESPNGDKPVRMRTPTSDGKPLFIPVGSDWSIGLDLPCAFSRAPKADTAALVAEARVKAVPGLRVAFDEPPDEATVQALVENTALRRLDVSGRALGDSLLARVAEILSLRSLSVSEGRSVTEAGLARLAKLPHLERLTLGSLSIDDSALAAALSNRGLIEFVAFGMNLTDATADELARHPRLRRLSLNGTHMTDRGASRLAALSDLTDLDLSYTAVGDEGLAVLDRLRHIERLLLWRTAVTDASMKLIGHMQHLRHLDLGVTAVTNAGLAHLAGAERLESLILIWTAIDDEGAAHLARIRSLRLLDVSHTRVTEAGVNLIRGALPGIEVKQR